MKEIEFNIEITLNQLTQLYIMTSPFAMFISSKWVQDKIAIYYVWKAKRKLAFFKDRKQYFEDIYERSMK